MNPSENPSIACARESLADVLEGNLRALAGEIGQAAWSSWIEPLQIVSTDPPVIEAPTRFHADRVKQAYAERLEELLGRRIEIGVAAEARGVRQRRARG